MSVVFKPRYRENRMEEMTQLSIVSGFNVAENRRKQIFFFNFTNFATIKKKKST